MKKLLITLTALLAFNVSANQNTKPQIYSVTPETCKSVHATWSPIYYGDMKLIQIYKGKALVFDNQMVIYVGKDIDLSEVKQGMALRDILNGQKFLIKVADVKMPNRNGFMDNYELFSVTSEYNKFISCSNRLWDEKRFNTMMQKYGWSLGDK